MSQALNVEPRERLGSRFARRLRESGRIPCNIQGAGGTHDNFSIEEHAFLTARRHHEHLFDLEFDDGRNEAALVRELQYDAFGDRILHVEFRRVIRGQETDAEVELEFVGRTTEGFLNHLVTHVTIAAIPSLIPDAIEVDISELHVGKFIIASDLVLPEGVRLVTDPETPIANLSLGRGAGADDEVEGEGEEAPDVLAAPTEGGDDEN